MRVKTLLRTLLGLPKPIVIDTFDLVATTSEDDRRPTLKVEIRMRKRKKGSCGLCGDKAPWYDQGDGTRTWRHVDVGFARCELVALAPRVDCPEHGVTVAAVAWARHDCAFTTAFDDLIAWEALASNKNAAADRYELSWRAVDNMCDRVVAEALDRTDMLADLTAIGIDEVKYKKGQKYLTVVVDHSAGRVVWAAQGRSKQTVGRFFDDLGDKRAAQIRFVTCDGADWIRNVVFERAPEAIVCLDTFHCIQWATDALDEVRRDQWRDLRISSNGDKAKIVKGLRWVMLRNWERLSGKQQQIIRDLETSNRRMFRAWRLKEELRDIFTMAPLDADMALDAWLRYASRSKLPAFVKLARTIRKYRESIMSTIEWGYTNGLAESANAKIGRLRVNARGFHRSEQLISMIFLDQPGIKPETPWRTT